MPCNTDYMNPSTREKQLQETAKLYRWLLIQLGETVPDSVSQTANNIYASTNFISDLCERITALRTRTPSAYESIVYNGRDKWSRRLADWWDEHQEADEQQALIEIAEQDDKALYEALTAHMSHDDKDFLRTYIMKLNSPRG